jgi:hypothetical protein
MEGNVVAFRSREAENRQRFQSVITDFCDRTRTELAEDQIVGFIGVAIYASPNHFGPLAIATPECGYLRLLGAAEVVKTLLADATLDEAEFLGDDDDDVE